MTHSVFVIMTKQKPKHNPFLHLSGGVSKTNIGVERIFIVSCGTFLVSVVDRKVRIIVWVIRIVYVTCIMSFIKCSYVENIGRVIHTPKTNPQRIIVTVCCHYYLLCLNYNKSISVAFDLCMRGQIREIRILCQEIIIFLVWKFRSQERFKC